MHIRYYVFIVRRNASYTFRCTFKAIYLFVYFCAKSLTVLHQDDFTSSLGNSIELINLLNYNNYDLTVHV